MKARRLKQCTVSSADLLSDRSLFRVHTAKTRHNHRRMQWNSPQPCRENDLISGRCSKVSLSQSSLHFENRICRTRRHFLDEILFAGVRISNCLWQISCVPRPSS